MEKFPIKAKRPTHREQKRLRPRLLTKSLVTTFALSWIVVILASFKLYYVQAAPYLLLTHFTPKCMNVEVPKDMILTIHYDAPDTLPIPEDDGAEISRRNGERIERRKYMIDSTVNVSQKSENKRTSNNRNFEIRERSGNFIYHTAGYDPVTICVRSMTASPNKPSRIALKIDATIPVDKEEEKKKKEEEKRKKEEERKEAMMSHTRVNRNLNSVESQLKNMITSTSMLLKNAEYAKEQESKFNRTSETMYSASLWWPMIQLVILGVTGVIQGRYMLEYIKRHGL